MGLRPLSTFLQCGVFEAGTVSVLRQKSA